MRYKVYGGGKQRKKYNNEPRIEKCGISSSDGLDTFKKRGSREKACNFEIMFGEICRMPLLLCGGIFGEHELVVTFIGEFFYSGGP